MISRMQDQLLLMSDYDKGRIVGRIVGEILVQVAAELASAGAGAAVSAIRDSDLFARVAAKLGDVAEMTKIVGPELEAAHPGLAREMAEGVRPLGEVGEAELISHMCFVAGTPVLTANGPSPIECIQPGDFVESRDPGTKRHQLSLVTKTIVTHPPDLRHIGYQAEGRPRCEVTCTNGHPFYVPSRDAFVPASNLSKGDGLLLADGTVAHVVDIRTERGPPHHPFTTTTSKLRTPTRTSPATVGSGCTMPGAVARRCTTS